MNNDIKTNDTKLAVDIDENELVQFQTRYKDERNAHKRDLSLIFDVWFSQVCVVWNEALNNYDNHIRWTHDQLYQLLVGLNTHLSLRDALILSAMREIPMESLITLITEPMTRNSSELVRMTLLEVFEDNSVRPDIERVMCAIHIISDLEKITPQSFSAGLLSMKAYWLWWLGRINEAWKVNMEALSIDDKYPLSRIIFSALEHDIYPAWCRERLRKTVTTSDKASDEKSS
ncbi:hypothetical protein EJ419_01695 [Alloscardovia theropitheci]|uniref:DUF4192 family protein n=1 Tax=Alloscardovia theropitheci TaxID=2496842 RepID=A0A4R0R145_9BIFI|nr:hypothetical protein [Alloscardovia theropitheci]TCD54836.1 hypothetical protein EJ419_01695 [Alloscardovia theropitheci]